eukprot:CAMPEP_0172651810 /NCGR_PEP_ID=MMETSP1068-20121228/243000_1 /TAXON_ID=35684 /ORGANISM="Pseudopedinella elastica, Strain CCMP716" /LENGTH=542 /DNA_ID=CAMNT_0013466213 /DNA_START=58 /DNA_END=1686 /DNA_ORIENTATION=+
MPGARTSTRRRWQLVWGSPDEGEALPGVIDLRAVCAEVVAMTFFVLIGCGVAAGNGAFDGATRLLVALGFGFAITVLAYKIGKHSGGQINCAVTLSLVVGGIVPWYQGLANTLGQLLGSLLGASLLAGVFPCDQDMTTNLGSNLVNPDYGHGRAFFAEFLGTAFLCLVVYETAVHPKSTSGDNAPLAIGLAVFLAHLLLLPIDGCSVNPTRSFGPAVVSAVRGCENLTPGGLADLWVMLLGPLCGGVLAAALQRPFLSPPSRAARRASTAFKPDSIADSLADSLADDAGDPNGPKGVPGGPSSGATLQSGEDEEGDDSSSLGTLTPRLPAASLTASPPKAYAVAPHQAPPKAPKPSKPSKGSASSAWAETGGSDGYGGGSDGYGGGNGGGGGVGGGQGGSNKAATLLVPVGPAPARPAAAESVGIPSGGGSTLAAPLATIPSLSPSSAPPGPQPTGQAAGAGRAADGARPMAATLAGAGAEAGAASNKWALEPLPPLSDRFTDRAFAASGGSAGRRAMLPPVANSAPLTVESAELEPSQTEL